MTEYTRMENNEYVNHYSTDDDFDQDFDEDLIPVGGKQ